MTTLNTYPLTPRVCYLYPLKDEEMGGTHKDLSGGALYQNNKNHSLVLHNLYLKFVFHVFFFKFCFFCVRRASYNFHILTGNYC